MNTNDLITNEVELQGENLEPTSQEELNVVLNEQPMTEVFSVLETEVENPINTSSEESKEDASLPVDVLIVIKENFEDHKVEYEAFLDEDKFKSAYPGLLFKSQRKTIDEVKITTRLIEVIGKINDSVFYLIRKTSIGQETAFYVYNSAETAIKSFSNLKQSEKGLWTDLDKYGNGLVGVLVEIN